MSSVLQIQHNASAVPRREGRRGGHNVSLHKGDVHRHTQRSPHSPQLLGQLVVLVPAQLIVCGRRLVRCRGVDDDNRLQAASLDETHRADEVDEVPHFLPVRAFVLGVFDEYRELGMRTQLLHPLLQALEEPGLPQLGLRGEFLSKAVEAGLFFRREGQRGPVLVEIAWGRDPIPRAN